MALMCVLHLLAPVAEDKPFDVLGGVPRCLRLVPSLVGHCDFVPFAPGLVGHGLSVAQGLVEPPCLRSRRTCWGG